MTDTGSRGQTEPARHELPDIDAAALAAAVAAERALRAADEVGLDRWVRFLAPLPDQLRDGSLRDVRLAARQARATFGPKDSIRDALPAEATEPLLATVDRLLKAIAHYEAHR
ncbi:MAG TPA: hypothetical protein VKR30_01740 [Candidatus Limnocylindrales bacterium]|nr:hypothetical protein [Candidatus Limnocylindrales bacterium]